MKYLTSCNVGINNFDTYILGSIGLKALLLFF